MNKEIIPLTALGEGQSGIVSEVQGELSGRLCDLGLTPGAKVTAVMRAPLGDPTAYRIRGVVTAIRKKDAAGVLVKPIAGEGEQ